MRDRGAGSDEARRSPGSERLIFRVVFLGSPDFAVPSLESLARDDRFDVSLVVTQPDRPAGRGRRLTPPPIKVAAGALGLSVHQPESLRDAESVEPLIAARPDLLVVVAYGEILRQDVLHLAPHGAVNVHPSLLPLYRGSAPIRTAILNGDEITGVSIIQLIRKLDAGPVLRQEELEVLPDDDAETLSDRLSQLAAEMLPQTCADWINGAITAIDQDESAATMTREWTRDDARIDWRESAAQVARLVRASQPWPVAWTMLDGEPFRVHRAAVGQTDDLPVGVARRVGKLVVAGCADGDLKLSTVQPAGKRAMLALNWWNGVQTDEVRFGE